MKSLIESGMRDPGEEIEHATNAHLQMLDRIAGKPTEESTPVFTQPTQEPKGGGPGMKVIRLDDKGKFVRANIESNGTRQWASAWDADAEALRSAGEGAMIDAELKKSGEYTNLKKVKVLSDNIPF
tara:strand:+ start:104 stop:481 length:378 start_codon:yes stop_codon:yes gene_type:complete